MYKQSVVQFLPHMVRNICKCSRYSNVSSFSLIRAYLISKSPSPCTSSNGYCPILSIPRSPSRNVFSLHCLYPRILGLLLSIRGENPQGHPLGEMSEDAMVYKQLYYVIWREWQNWRLIDSRMMFRSVRRRSILNARCRFGI